MSIGTDLRLAGVILSILTPYAASVCGLERHRPVLHDDADLAGAIDSLDPDLIPAAGGHALDELEAVVVQKGAVLDADDLELRVGGDGDGHAGPKLFGSGGLIEGNPVEQDLPFAERKPLDRHFGLGNGLFLLLRPLVHLRRERFAGRFSRLRLFDQLVALGTAGELLVTGLCVRDLGAEVVHDDLLGERFGSVQLLLPVRHLQPKCGDLRLKRGDVVVRGADQLGSVEPTLCSRVDVSVELSGGGQLGHQGVHVDRAIRGLEPELEAIGPRAVLLRLTVTGGPCFVIGLVQRVQRVDVHLDLGDPLQLLVLGSGFHRGESEGVERQFADEVVEHLLG